MTSILFLLVSLTLADLPAHDATKRVHDFAGLLPLDNVTQLEALCRDVERQTTAQFAIVTVPDLQGETVEDYAQQLFNTWGIGQKDTNNGVLLLVAPKEHRMRIEVGYGLEPLLTDSVCGSIRDAFILPFFKQNQYPEGITKGADEIAKILLKHPNEAKGAPGSGPIFFRNKKEDALGAVGVVGIAGLVLVPIGWWAARRKEYSTTFFIVLVSAVVAVIGVAIYLMMRVRAPLEIAPWLGGAGATAAGTLFYNFRKYRRYRPHHCSKCGSRLELLDEKSDDEKLTPVQQLEEKIGAVNYDVWYCPACLNTDTEKYIGYFTGFQECPACHARTFKEGPQRVVYAATTVSSGLAEVEGECVSCNKKQRRTVILPRISTSSSSSSSGSSSSGGGGSSSFGGGSSGGGGASGSW